ncbi:MULTISPECIES: squalene synthase HpnC [unclassified Paraburkholderia]|uniref:squalene synthase HpnC n=1 Tax=unclassified Paraburkholderia TaxID=2615204 RepID=UPI0016110529|nr:MULTISPECIES: squalene synthase HpnC [unclassified Paraburkholderia]MBB5443008.1 squalene synthase HpnC [Paraburkholderia sp. WSM4177]MBB5483387.1 squalene synthase HpnC [Paraburkholderia sp. WSM4180]
MDVDQHENFPIASVLLPKALRAPVGIIYQVVRTAADISAEGQWNAVERHARLADFRAGLDAIAQRRAAPVHALLFGKLAGVIAQYELPLEPFYDLLDGCAQDIDTNRYADRAALVDYCRRSAHPVGHLLLHLVGAATPHNLADADAICTASQLISFWLDVAADWQRQHVYLPQADLRRFGVTEAQIADGVVDDAWHALMAYEIAFVRATLVRGAPLALRMPGRLGIELCGAVHAGFRFLERIERADYDVFRARPVLNPFDWCVVAARTLKMRLSRRVGMAARSIEGNA